MYRTCLTLVACVLPTICPLAADDELDGLIEDLTRISEPGIGYSYYFSGSQFLPYPDTEQLSTFVFGGARRSQSDTLKSIVAKGADAVPTLLEHLSDDRKIAMKPLAGMMWMDYPDEYDFNRRTRNSPPAGVNRESPDFDKKSPQSHAITVGDLCFVALGQIVNRNFSASHYQPTGGLVISSPTYSKRLRDVLIADWSDLTAEKHRQLLIEDFDNPDHADRWLGAYWRLSFYYPDAVIPSVLKLLELPVYKLDKVVEFCRNTLYPAKPELRRQLYDDFIRENGSQYSAAVMETLFGDLELFETYHDADGNSSWLEFSTEPKELLIQLFSKSSSVHSSERGPQTVMSDEERVWIVGSLTRDDSRQIGEAVKRLYLMSPDDIKLAPACLKCLANRGDDGFLLEQINAIDLAVSEANELHSEKLRAIATSKSEVVRMRLMQVIQETANDVYFYHALSGLENVGDTLVKDNAIRVLEGLPEDSDEGYGLLQLTADKFPSAAEEVFKAYLAIDSVQRTETVCSVLGYNHPLAPRILAPLLNDRREVSGGSEPTRVCDLAAESISATTDDIRYGRDWSLRNRDIAIEKLKEYCRGR